MKFDFTGEVHVITSDSITIPKPRVKPKSKVVLYIQSNVKATLIPIRHQGMIAIVDVNKNFNIAYTLHERSLPNNKTIKFYYYLWDINKVIHRLYLRYNATNAIDPVCCFKFRPFTEHIGNITNDYQFNVNKYEPDDKHEAEI